MEQQGGDQEKRQITRNVVGEVNVWNKQNREIWLLDIDVGSFSNIFKGKKNSIYEGKVFETIKTTELIITLPITC